MWNHHPCCGNDNDVVKKKNTVDSAFDELGYNEISEFVNIHFFKTIIFNKDITMKGDKILFFLDPLNFAKFR